MAASQKRKRSIQERGVFGSSEVDIAMAILNSFVTTVPVAETIISYQTISASSKFFPAVSKNVI
jgi:hypothetical protein